MDTLDKLHASQIKIINENNEKLPKYVSELNELTATNEKLNLDEYDKLKNLKSNIEKIKNDKVDYYMKTGEILFQYYDNDINKTWSNLKINFDLFTSTRTQNHEEVVQNIFLDLLEKDLIYSKDMMLPYCEDCKRFLADRYVEGTCPNKDCNSKDARGDQCDDCGKTLDPKDLIDMICKICSKSDVIDFKNSSMSLSIRL